MYNIGICSTVCTVCAILILFHFFFIFFSFLLSLSLAYVVSEILNLLEIYFCMSVSYKKGTDFFFTLKNSRYGEKWCKKVAFITIQNTQPHWRLSFHLKHAYMWRRAKKHTLNTVKLGNFATPKNCWLNIWCWIIIITCNHIHRIASQHNKWIWLNIQWWEIFHSNK